MEPHSWRRGFTPNICWTSLRRGRQIKPSQIDGVPCGKASAGGSKYRSELPHLLGRGTSEGIDGCPMFAQAYSGFPVELAGAGELYAAFLNESRTRGRWWRPVQEIRIRGPKKMGEAQRSLLAQSIKDQSPNLLQHGDDARQCWSEPSNGSWRMKLRASWTSSVDPVKR
jgi:hypothetical protein